MNMQHLNNAGKLDLDFGKNGVMRIDVPGHPGYLHFKCRNRTGRENLFRRHLHSSRRKPIPPRPVQFRTAAWTVSLVMRAL